MTPKSRSVPFSPVQTNEKIQTFRNRRSSCSTSSSLDSKKDFSPASDDDREYKPDSDDDSCSSAEPNKRPSRKKRQVAPRSTNITRSLSTSRSKIVWIIRLV